MEGWVPAPPATALTRASAVLRLPVKPTFPTSKQWLKIPFGTLFFAVPGVNDSFLTVHAWLRQPLRQQAAIRLGKVLEEVRFSSVRKYWHAVPLLLNGRSDSSKENLEEGFFFKGVWTVVRDSAYPANALPLM